MKIIGSLTSPYARIVRVLCHELGFEYELAQTAPFGKLSEEQKDLIEQHNPLLRVPILIDGKTELIESRIIAYYLLDKAKKSRPSLEQENIISAIYGALDAGITRFMLLKSDPRLNPNRGYFPRFQERMASSLQWINDLAAKNIQNFGKSTGLAEIVLISALDWLEKRNVFDWKNLSHLVRIHSELSKNASFTKTRIPDVI